MNQNKTATSEYKGTNQLLIGIVLSVITFTLFAQTTLNIAPTMRADLGINMTSSNLAVSITSLFSGMFIVVMGGISDRLGRVRIIRVGLLLSTIGSALIALSPTGTAAFLIPGRIIQGLSAACIMPSTLALIKTYYQGPDRQRAISYYSMGAWGGSGLTSLFGGFLATTIGWRWIFWISIAVAILSFLFIQGTPESRPTSAKSHQGYDIPGILIFILGMVSLNLLIGQGASLGWLSPAVLGLAAVAVIALGTFVVFERKVASPFIDFALFRNQMYLGATMSNFLLNSAAGTLMVTLSLVQIGAGMSAFEAGLLTIGYLIAVLITIRIGERLLQKRGPRLPMVLGSAITGTGIFLLTSTFLLASQYRIVATIAFTLFGAGLGFYATPSTDAALSTVPADQAGSAAGIYKMSSSLGAALGIAISAALFTGLSNGQVVFAEGLFLGRVDNIAVRFAAAIALLFNLIAVLLAITSILVTIPPSGKPDAPGGSDAASRKGGPSRQQAVQASSNRKKPVKKTK